MWALENENRAQQKVADIPSRREKRTTVHLRGEPVRAEGCEISVLLRGRILWFGAQVLVGTPCAQLQSKLPHLWAV